MINNIRNILIFTFFFSVSQTYTEQIWFENFLIPDKGIWGDEDGQTIHSDFSGIKNWFFDIENILLSSPDQYAKTVSTSGGRFEVRNVDSEVVWRSEWINIKNYSNVSIQLMAYETGSGSNENNKYLKAYYRINDYKEILFNTNGINVGNWGSALVEQTGLGGDSLQIVVYMSNYYSSDKVALDEIFVTGDTDDNLPPFITDIKVNTADTLIVSFNEPINTEILGKENFFLFSEEAEVIISEISQINANFICLNIVPSGLLNMTLKVSKIYDLSGNMAETDSFSFLYLPPVQTYDVVINEIMADPSPPLGLPEFEFVEIYNRAVYPVQLQNWKIVIDETQKLLETTILLPYDYLILTSTGGFDFFSDFGKVMAVKGFPSVRNMGAKIGLISDQGNMIDQINYSIDWPLDPEKSGGGWSVERIDPNRFCGQANNWCFSENEKGGTPGSENSVKKDNQDNQPPWVQNVEAITANSLELKFSESMDTIFYKGNLNFSVSDGIGNPDSINLISLRQVALYFSDSFSEDKPYNISFGNLSDECGNRLVDKEISFTWSVARPGNILISEVLSNPYPEGTDFVEFYNNSEKILHLDHLCFSNGKDTIGLNSANGEEIIFEPGSYLVCTKDSGKVAAPYFSSCLENIYTISNFPNIYNNEGSIILMNQEFEVIDQFNYYEDFHSPLLAEISGVSLERISFKTETSVPENWQSAARSYGYATPGCENSQTERGYVTSVVFEPESFSPNLDGYNDEYRINYQLGKSGYVANAWIFDASGQLIFQLAKNEILATEGSITWNGGDETGQKLPMGVYIVLVEMFDLRGNIKQYKDAVVLTDILE